MIGTTTRLRWVSVARLAELPPDSVSAVQCEGQVLALVNAGGDVCALENTCPHRGGPLARWSAMPWAADGCSTAY